MTAEMDLFLVQHPNGIQIGHGQVPLGSFAVFPGLGKQLPKVLRVLPPPTPEGVYDISPCLALTAVGSCIRALAPEDHIAAFLDCLYPVDKLNAAHPRCVSGFAREVFGSDYCSILAKAGVHYVKKDKYNHAFKLIRGGKSYWFRIDFERSQNLRRMVNGGRSPYGGLQSTPPDGSGSSDVTE